MSILYRVVQRENPQNRDLAPLFYLQAVKRGNISFTTLVQYACKDSTIDPYELQLGINRAFDKAEEYLGQGFSVSFGDLGNVYLTITSSGSETAEDVTSAKKKSIRLHFVWGKKIKAFLQTIKLEKKIE